MKNIMAWGTSITLFCLTNWAGIADDLSPKAATLSGLANNLVGYWSFDETSGGILHDYSGHGYNGTLVSFPNGQGNWTTGKLGGALLFGGPDTGQSVQVANFAMPTNSMTLTAWVWANSLPRWATIAANWNGGWGAFNYATYGGTPNMSLYVADANVQGGINIDHGTSSASLPLGQWHFMAFVANSQTSTITFMQDGVVAGSFHYFGKLLASSSQLNIGDDPSDINSGQGNWNGKIDDLAIWNRALSAQELATIYSAGLAGRPLSSILGLFPTITCPNAQTVECGTPATVTVRVADPLGAAMTVVWTVDGITVQTNAVPAGQAPTAADVSFTSELPLGTNTVAVAVTDSNGNTAACSTTTTVIDTTAPVITSAIVSPNVLWPPNHKLVLVHADAAVMDNCSATNWKIISVQSNQSVTGLGSGHTLQDWQIQDNRTVLLRAERSGAAARIYTITLQAEDDSGNLSDPKTVTVTVP